MPGGHGAPKAGQLKRSELEAVCVENYLLKSKRPKEFLAVQCIMRRGMRDSLLNKILRWERVKVGKSRNL